MGSFVALPCVRESGPQSLSHGTARRLIIERSFCGILAMEGSPSQRMRRGPWQGGIGAKKDSPSTPTRPHATLIGKLDVPHTHKSNKLEGTLPPASYPRHTFSEDQGSLSSSFLPLLTKSL